MLERPQSPSRAELRRLGDQRYRQRLREGRAVYLVEITGPVFDLLIKTHWISEEELTNKATVERALSEMLIASALLERLADAAR